MTPHQESKAINRLLLQILTLFCKGVLATHQLFQKIRYFLLSSMWHSFFSIVILWFCTKSLSHQWCRSKKANQLIDNFYKSWHYFAKVFWQFTNYSNKIRYFVMPSMWHSFFNIVMLWFCTKSVSQQWCRNKKQTN